MSLYIAVLTLLIASVRSESFLDGDINIFDGVKLASVPVSNSLEDEGRSFGDSVLGRMAKFLQGHELVVKLPNLIEKEKIGQIVTETLKAVDAKDSAVTGRKKGGGDGGVTLLALLMAKTLGALGVGGLGLLTMKALMVSALALMLSAIVGVKKLSSHGDDEGGHQVYHVEAGHHHHRRRRDADEFETPLPYRAWDEYNPYKNE